MDPTYDRAKAGQPPRTYIQQLCEDTGCSPEDLPEAMSDREKRRERVRDIHASDPTWWWWCVWDRKTILSNDKKKIIIIMVLLGLILLEERKAVGEIRRQRIAGPEEIPLTESKVCCCWQGFNQWQTTSLSLSLSLSLDPTSNYFHTNQLN